MLKTEDKERDLQGREIQTLPGNLRESFIKLVLPKPLFKGTFSSRNEDLKPGARTSGREVMKRPGSV